MTNLQENCLHIILRKYKDDELSMDESVLLIRCLFEKEMCNCPQVTWTEKRDDIFAPPFHVTC